MQGNKENILTCPDKILAFKSKPGVWNNHISKGNFEMFPHLLGQAAEMNQEIAQHIQNQLGDLEVQLCNYFTSLTTSLYD
jgi:Zn-dependent M32 family carboxypeptidase